MKGVRGLGERWADLRFAVWSWWRASDIHPDPAFMNRDALLRKVLWLQEQWDATLLENRQLREKLRQDDYLLGRPPTPVERSEDGVST